jgi:hypothetical protein
MTNRVLYSRIAAAVLTLTLLVTTACDDGIMSRSLSRKTAERLLRAEPQIVNGSFKFVAFPYRFDFSCGASSQRDEVAVFKKLEAEGYVTVSSVMGDFFRERCVVTSADRIRELPIGSPDTSNADLFRQDTIGRNIYLRTLRYRLGPVTGVSQADDAPEAVVEFKLTLIPAPYAGMLPFPPRQERESDVKAFFRRYDDGWKLEKFERGGS